MFFQARYRQLKELYRISDADVARATGRQKGAVSLWKHGENNPKFDGLISLRDAFGVSIDWLCGDEHADPVAPRVRQAFARLRVELMENGQNYGTTSAERSVNCLRFLAQRAQELAAPWLLRAYLNINEDTLGDIRDGRYERVEDYHLERFAQLTGVAKEWFYTGKKESLTPPDIDRYSAVVVMLQADGITPDDLARSREVLKTLKLTLRDNQKSE